MCRILTCPAHRWESTFMLNDLIMLFNTRHTINSPNFSDFLLLKLTPVQLNLFRFKNSDCGHCSFLTSWALEVKDLSSTIVLYTFFFKSITCIYSISSLKSIVLPSHTDYLFLRILESRTSYLQHTIPRLCHNFTKVIESESMSLVPPW